MNMQKFWEFCESQGIYDNANDYAEPGYSLDCDKVGILLADWNDISKKVQHALSVKFELEWDDEWVTCYDCGRALRQSPDSYHWQASYIIQRGDFVCLDCMDIEDLIGFDAADNMDDCYIDNHRIALTWPIYKHIGGDSGLAEYGWIMYDDKSRPYFPGEYENGFHPGQDANPEAILKEIKHKYPGCEVLFAMTDQGQFDVTFKAFYRLPLSDNDESEE